MIFSRFDVDDKASPFVFHSVLPRILHWSIKSRTGAEIAHNVWYVSIIVLSESSNMERPLKKKNDIRSVDYRIVYLCPKKTFNMNLT